MTQINAATIVPKHVLEIDLEYPKKKVELHYDYPFAPDKIEIKKEILSSYQLKIAVFNIPVATV